MIRLLRERGLGNSSTRLMKQLNENHSEEWMQRTVRYLTECSQFVQCPGISPLTFKEPPAPIPVPSYKWILSVYGQDIIERLDEIKAHITSTYGTVLKMDSTKKVIDLFLLTVYLKIII